MNTLQSYASSKTNSIATLSISFWRHKSKTAGKASLYCRVMVNGDRAEMGSTQIKIWCDHWNSERQMISDQDPESHFKNEMLDLLRNQIRAVYNDLYRKREKITAAKIRRAWSGQTTCYSLLSVFDLYLEDSAADTERNLRQGSLRVYENVRKNLDRFLTHQKATDLLVEDFDLMWTKKLRQWMKKSVIKGGKVGHADMYMTKQIQTIKSVLSWAKLNKLADENPLQGLRIKNVQGNDPNY